MISPWLNTVLNEDACRIRRENSAENYAIVRHTALNLLNADKRFKASIKRKYSCGRPVLKLILILMRLSMAILRNY